MHPLHHCTFPYPPRAFLHGKSEAQDHDKPTSVTRLNLLASPVYQACEPKARFLHTSVSC
ncbi:hypothetical protein L227DRAFT_46390 [Lentinus tigrinus ALCF2SS1-6]|uniref:Uncharacterized protein n=1 Tax=Lentinus tigrinus ALCF2SS1-6 TaxID=1328759 RepID=A0A5C2SFG5_9APHY|nr:hypothetical protein L227DRAFT_46390 [Lentinus tigrinus ALCF2SS1-6]